MKTVTYIVSDIDKSLHFEWVALHLRAHYKLRFILIGTYNSALESFLKAHHIPVLVLENGGKLKLALNWFRVFVEMFIHRPAVIHTHLWIANLIGLTAGYLAFIPVRIMTRHHGTIHYDEFPGGRKWDVLCNFLATKIIAISENIRTILVDRDGAKPSKVVVIHHGFELSYFTQVAEERIATIRSKYQIPAGKGPVIGVIARYMGWKGIQYILPAFQQLRYKYPEAVLVLANANGPFKAEVHKVLESWSNEWYREIQFEHDLVALYKVFDIYVHVPVDPAVEAFGQTYVEALLTGIPSIFTLSGIAAEFINHEHNALVVPFRNADAIYQSMVRLLENQELARHLVETGTSDAKKFSFEKYLSKIMKLYTPDAPQG